MIMVVKANQVSSELGAVILPLLPLAQLLYEVGFNHFYRGNDLDQGADLIFFPRSYCPRYLFKGFFRRENFRRANAEL